MKKQIIAGILGLTMVAGLSTPAFAAIDFFNEVENNDTFKRANEFPLKTHTMINGKASRDDDYDYFKFKAPETTFYTFDFGAANIELPVEGAEVTLYDANRKKITSGEVDSRNELKFSEKLIKDQEYFIRVENNSSRFYDYILEVYKRN